ncbi:MAG TPA: hypothetical protein VNL71_19735 [Chloroflexota bacterium]|nr:hypothetical protein [Chloroflexota bacterium]
MKRKLTVLVVLAGLAVSLLLSGNTRTANAAAPAIHPTSVAATRAAFLEKTRFLADLGLAYYAFHHFVYARYQNGGFSYGARGRAGNVVKAGIALLFAYNRMSAAEKIAAKSHSRLLHLLASPLTVLVGGVLLERTRLQHGQYQAGDLHQLGDSFDSYNRTATARGYAIRDLPVTIKNAA